LLGLEFHSGNSLNITTTITVASFSFGLLIACRELFPLIGEGSPLLWNESALTFLSMHTFRLIAAVHVNKQRVFTLQFLTHSEYSKDEWKKLL
jgi:hypothetical protein